MRMRRRWDIFCSVVDNFGDIGVCWRLARRLSVELAQDVRLWVDDLHSFRKIQAAVDAGRSSQVIDGVEVMYWPAAFPAVEPADIVVEGFGVHLPDGFQAAMAVRAKPPVWINLEYLSAEAWVDEHHRLPSPHPRLPLTKYFFFPGFTRATGGVIIENGLLDVRRAFQADPIAALRFRQSIGIAGADRKGLWLSLFCYENAALPAMVEKWAADANGVNCVVAEGLALAQIEKIAGRKFPPDGRIEIGRLALHAIPFLDLKQYDRLLWSCDVNFVRGEDSFVRAQLAARPLVWQAYPQEAGAHLEKAAAFRDRYFRMMGHEAATAGKALFDGWNRQIADCADCWPDFRRDLGAYTANAAAWAAQIAENGDLAANLAIFCEDRLE